MTLWAFLGDVHGRLPLLERAVAACRRRGAERFIVLGDSLGQGDSDGVVRLVREIADISVVGNRDLDWLDRVGPDTRAYVRTLPVVASAADFVAVHGDSRLCRELSVDDRRKKFERIHRVLRERSARCVFFGHTHQPGTWRKAGPGSEPERLPLGLAALEGGEESVFVVCVGSVGLPFPGKGPTSCALYDDGAKTVRHLALGPARGRVPEWAEELVRVD